MPHVHILPSRWPLLKFSLTSTRTLFNHLLSDLPRPLFHLFHSHHPPSCIIISSLRITSLYHTYFTYLDMPVYSLGAWAIDESSPLDPALCHGDNFLSGVPHLLHTRRHVSPPRVSFPLHVRACLVMLDWGFLGV